MCGDGQSKPHLQYLTRPVSTPLVTGEECPVLARVTGPDRHCWRQSHCLSLLPPHPTLTTTSANSSSNTYVSPDRVCVILSVATHCLTGGVGQTSDSDSVPLHCLARSRSSRQCHVCHQFHSSHQKTLPRLPRTATAGPLQCRCRSHRHFHCSGYDDAADED